MSVLQISAEGPVWATIGADTLLFLHITGGSLAIVSGIVASFAPKGAVVHRVAGTVFFISMLVATGIGAAVAPFLTDGQRVNTVAGTLGFYLVLTAWLAAKREVRNGLLEKIGLVIALATVSAGVLFAIEASRSPTGTIDDSPPQAFYLFMIIGGFAAFGDLNAILRGRLSEAARIARHLWRMCAAFIMAAGSFFLGQQKFLPEFVHGSPWLFASVLLPLALMLFWLVRVRLTRWAQRTALA